MAKTQICWGEKKAQVWEILQNIFVQLFAPGGGSEIFRKQHMWQMLLKMLSTLLKDALWPSCCEQWRNVNGVEVEQSTFTVTTSVASPLSHDGQQIPAGSRSIPKRIWAVQSSTGLGSPLVTSKWAGMSVAVCHTGTAASVPEAVKLCYCHT